MIIADDAEDLFYLRTNDQVMQYVERPRPANVEEVVKMIHDTALQIERGELLMWGISLHSTAHMFGTIGFYRMSSAHFRAEIGYMLKPSHGSMGFMSEALSAVIDFGFDHMKMHSIEADINPANERSRNILKKHGFKKKAYFRENYYFEGIFLDSEIYGLLKSEWQNR
ncbi:MAG: GNAT family N-acetyltransferase [Saprospiraceae bacterium]